MEQAFNGDHFIANRVLSLRDQFQIKDAVETGTYFGGTAHWLAANFARCFTVELNLERLQEGIAMGPNANLAFYHGSSPAVLRILGDIICGPAFVYLDAHWNEYWPLLDELDALSSWKSQPVIAIHDFKVPDEPDLGYDSYLGMDLGLDYVSPKMDRIFGIGRYECEFNCSKTAAGARRGVAYFYRKV